MEYYIENPLEWLQFMYNNIKDVPTIPLEIKEDWRNLCIITVDIQELCNF